MRPNGWAALGIIGVIIAFALASATLSFTLLSSNVTTTTTGNQSGLELITAGGGNELSMLRGCSPDEILKFQSNGNWACSEDTSEDVTGSGVVALDLGDDDINESDAINEIATVGDTNSIFTESSPDKLTIGVTANWPTSDFADALSANGANCPANQGAGGVDAAGAAEDCTDYALAGANSDITSMDGLTGGIQTPDFIDINPTTAQAHAQGRIYYDSDDDTLVIFNAESEVALNVGEENWTFARNDTGVTIADGEVVYISGATGNRPTIALAQADSITTSHTIGVATHSIENNTDGFVTNFGIVKDLDTSSFNAGDILWVSATTPGEFVATEPQPPNQTVRLGVVLVSNASNGRILVNPGPPLLFYDTIQNQGVGLTQRGTLNVTGSGVTCSDTGTVTECDIPGLGATTKRSINIVNPTTSESNLAQYEYGSAATTTEVSCSTNTGTVTVQLDERARATPNSAGTDVMTSTLVCDTDSQTTTSFTNAGIAADVPVNLQITATSGAPGVVRIHIKATLND